MGARLNNVGIACAAPALFLLAGPAYGETVIVNPAKDNTLFGPPLEANSNGAGPHLFAGETSFAGVRRALLEFDVAGSLPAGATIESVTLTLRLSIGVGGAFPFGLHAVAAEWGEGASNSGTGNQGTGTGGGQGVPAAEGDATWNHTIFPNEFWAVPGGDFAVLPSSVCVVTNAPMDFVFESTPLMVADVQSWLDNPDQNHGWLVLGVELGDFVAKAKRFESREHPDPAVRPRLTITYSSGSAGCQTCGGDMDASGGLDGLDMQRFVDCMLAPMPGDACDCADVNEDGAADSADVAQFAERLLVGTMCQ